MSILEDEHLSNLSEEKWRKTPKVPKVLNVEDEHLSEPLMDEAVAFEERAASLQYDAAFSREKAEAEAAREAYAHLDEKTRALYDDLDHIPAAFDMRSRSRRSK